ncbi:MAG: type II toxin-antitoxin system VapC family toxin [Cyanobacteria bacterium P01_F01_bin.4]
MKGWLLDTNVVSELRKPRCHPGMKQWADSQPPQSFYLSTVTIAEIRYGIEQVKDLAFAHDLTQWLSETLRPWFSERLLAIDEDVILVRRRLVEKGRKQGHTFCQPDIFLAATAMLHDLCLVTRNTNDFTYAEVTLYNPFVDP